MKRLTGVVANGKFIVGKTRMSLGHDGVSEERRSRQRVIHSAELVQPFKPDGTINPDYGTLYHDAAIRQGIIDEDPEPNYQKFE